MNAYCCAVQTRFTEYLDGQLEGREMQRIGAHLAGCPECASEWASLQRVQSSLVGLGLVPEPRGLLARINAAVSQERMCRQNPFYAWAQSWAQIWKEDLEPFLLQASAGLVSAVLLLGTVIVMVGMFAQPESAQAKSDEPLGNATAPRLLYLPTGTGASQIGAVSGPVVVEAYVNKLGRVYDYRIVSGPTDGTTRSQIENLLLFGVFEPARRFGQPVRGLTVLSFSGVSVRG
jgi:anti-sigma factor RsiW